ncbi:hypothetical protein DFH27DRAFT_615463 [Peziza echinospora]|nr:hypothetical protein DFH27DRAFT_615463 [Peziza echinospora]
MSAPQPSASGTDKKQKPKASPGPPPPPVPPTRRHLLSLPTELLILTIQYASSSPPPGAAGGKPSGLQTLMNLSRSCKALHYTVFCPESDETIWRHMAITRLGTHPGMGIEGVKYPGRKSRAKSTFPNNNNSRAEKRCWRDVVRFGVAWERPFPICEFHDGTVGPVGQWKVQKAMRSFRPLPAPRVNEKESGWGVEMVCPGDGDSRAQHFETKMPVGEGDQGRITFQVRRQEGGLRQQGGMGGGGGAAGGASAVKTRTVTAVVDLLGKGGARVGSRIRKGRGSSKVVYEDLRPGTSWTMTPFPGFCGLIVVEENRKDAEGNEVKNYVIKEVDPMKGVLVEEKVWDLGGRRPDRFVGEGDVVVALCFDDPNDLDAENENPEMPSSLVCVERVKNKDVGWLTTGETWKSQIRWQLNTTRDWKEDNDYTAFAHLKNFHVTKNHLVALVTRHPSPVHQKLTGTFFYVIDLKTGALGRKIKLRKRIPLQPTPSSSEQNLTAQQTTPAPTGANIFAPPPPPQTTPAAFTTAFNHDFLLTDNHLICGGPGGGLHVYNYCLPSPSSSSAPSTSAVSPDDGNLPLYTLPDPWATTSPFFKHNPDLTSSVPTEPLQGLFVGRQFSGLTLSTCGRYLGATTSDQFWVWDMVRKRIRGVWSNGRKVDKRDWYARSPVDGWVGGVWVLLNYQNTTTTTTNGLLSPDRGRGRERRSRGSGYVAAPMLRGVREEVGEEEDSDEEEEIMVGYLTDLGVPEAGEGAGGDVRAGRAGGGAGGALWFCGMVWESLRGVAFGREGLMGTLLWFGMAAVLALVAVVLTRGVYFFSLLKWI